MRNLVLFAAHDLQTVIQQNPGEFCRHSGHIDAGLRVGLADDRQGPDMIHVGMADDDGVQPALLLYGAKVGKGISGTGLPDAAVQ